ncbi:putative reductase [Thozetella sp. PMI_491]|nr:putative reductase [Thozetella sp. PMI_491]
MHILILGGTVFVGRAAVAEALARGHQVTVFNRGTKPAPDGVTTVIGDRLAPNGYSGLEGLKFDAVVDTWSNDAEAVTSAVKALLGRIRHYTYVSTLAVYDPGKFDLSQMYTEETPLYQVDAPGAEKAVYKYNKRRGEIAAETADVPVFLVRPGIILGPHEIVAGGGGRLPWWLQRVHRGGRVVAPGPKNLRTSFVDVRDLAKFIITGAEKGLAGGYSVLGGPDFPTMSQLLDTINEVTGRHAELVWKTPEEILAVKMNYFNELPLWYPQESQAYAMINNWDISKARRHGLVARTSEETIKDTWEWLESGEKLPTPKPGNGSPNYGLTPEHESELLG